jgi:hypothetical protein
MEGDYTNVWSGWRACGRCSWTCDRGIATRRAAAALILGLALALLAPRLAGAQGPGVEAPPEAQAPATLYRRLGGYDSLAVLTDDFVGRLVRDRTLSRFFARATDESKGRIRQLMLDQLCEASGARCIYPGRVKKSAHQGPGIREVTGATVGT